MRSQIIFWFSWLVVGLIVAGLLWRGLARSDEPGRLAMRWFWTALVLLGMWFWALKLGRAGGGGGMVGGFGVAALLVGGIATGAILLAMIWGRSIGEWVAGFFTSLFDDGGTELKPAPLYSTTEARRKQGRYEEAIAEVRKQLDRFPDDLRGILMLAEIQAQDLKDLPAARDTLESWMADQLRDPGHRAVILTKLADWSLHVGGDVDQARAYLQKILDDLPETDAALLAEQRLAHLEFEAAPRRGAIHMESGSGRPVDVGQPPPVPERPIEPEAEELARHLAVHPHDLAARERLALLYAWHYQRPDLARVELETLLALKNASPRDRVHWLNLLADVEIQVAGDLPAARNALQRIVDRNPNAAAAEQARHRIPTLPRELSRRSGPRTIGLPPTAPSEPWWKRNRGALGPRF